MYDLLYFVCMQLDQDIRGCWRLFFCFNDFPNLLIWSHLERFRLREYCLIFSLKVRHREERCIENAAEVWHWVLELADLSNAVLCMPLHFCVKSLRVELNLLVLF